MKKRILLRCLLGAPLGLALSTIITILISLVIGDGEFYPVVPALINDCGSELNAVLVQALCSLLYGAAWAGASIIWEMDDWSLLRQTLSHLIISSIGTFPVAYFMYWMKHSVIGIVVYFSIFFGIYLFIWLSTYVSMKRRINMLNSKIQENNTDKTK